MTFFTRWLLISYFVFFTGKVFSQERCGNEIYHQHIQQNPELKRAFDEVNQRIYTLSQTQRGAEDELLVIPIVVHVLHLGEPVGTGSNISDQQIFDAVRGANERWRNAAGNTVDMRVEFCLAQQDPDGNPSNGIVRKDARSLPDYEEFGIGYLGERGADETRLKRFSNWPHAYVYNIWVVHDIAGDWGGFAYFPFDQQYTADGVVIVANTMRYTSSTLAHELGHGMGLFHTFQDEVHGCPPNSNCAMMGDWVCDTPPHRQEDCATTPCASEEDSLVLSFKNIMAYCGGRYLFTEGQKTRARLGITTTARKPLLTSIACNVPPCDTVFTALKEETCDPNTVGVEVDTFQSASGCDSIVTLTRELLPAAYADFTYTIEASGTVSFQNLSADAETYSWDFGDDSASTEINPEHQYITQDIYEVTLVASNICGSDTAVRSIDLLASALDPSKTKSLELFPNPSTGNFSLMLPEGLKDFSIRIVNMWGQTVGEQHFTARSGRLNVSIDLSNGLYYLLLQDDSELYRSPLICLD